MNNPIKEIIENNWGILYEPELFSHLLEEKMPGQNLERFLIVLALEEGIPERLQYDYRRNKKKYVSELSEISGCTDDLANKIIGFWMDAIPYEEIEMGNLRPPLVEGESEIRMGDVYPEEDFSDDYPGRLKCNTMKAIRRKIAEANGIPYHTEECTYQGPCSGTCPKCDEEIRYLDKELQRKEARGEAINLAGLGDEEISNYIEDLTNVNEAVELIERGDYEAPKVLEMHIDELGLSVRSYNCLKRAGINTVEELTSRTAEEMMEVRNLGRKSLDEVLAKLKEFGLHLRESDV